MWWKAIQLVFLIVVASSAVSSCAPVVATDTKFDRTVIQATSLSPTQASSPTHQPDPPTAEPSPTTTATATTAPSATATQMPSQTPTPTEDPDILKPGVYDTGGCDRTSLRYDIFVQWCVINIEVTKDGFLMVPVSWTREKTGPSAVKVTKRSDVGNTNMILRDDSGHQYPLVGVGGNAAENVVLNINKPVYGTFTFGPMLPGKRLYEFKDADNGMVIRGMTLDKLIYTWETVQLKSMPYTLDYRSDKWSRIPAENGALAISLNLNPACQVHEWLDPEIKGTFKSNYQLGDVTYRISGWFEEDFSIREYLAESGFDGLEQGPKPFFHVNIPLDFKENCIDEASQVLGTLAERSSK
jgi:hypothetical protein